jgi:hypothetical protein
VDNITHPEPLLFGYEPAGNGDPDGDSDGTTITVNKPVPTPIYVADLDGVSFQHDSDEWKATVTVTLLDAHQNPVADAEVEGTWSNGKEVDCESDDNGQCTLTSDKFKNAEVDSITFTVDNVTHEELLIFSYDSAGNSDPDGDSDGATITVNKPS